MHDAPAGLGAGVDLQIARYQQGDREALLAFRREHYGAGAAQADPAYVDWQFRDAPGIAAQGAPLHVARSGGAIVGAMGRIRTSMYVDGKPWPATWTIDYAVRKDLRRHGIGERIGAISRKEEPGTGFSLEGSADTRGIAARAGYHPIAEVPLYVRPIDPVRWLRSRRVPAAIAWLAASARPALAALDALALRRARARSLELVATPELDARADALFAHLSTRYRVLCRRDREWLEWRFQRYPQRGRYRLYWLQGAGEPVGYAVLRAGTHHGVPSGVLADYLCAPELLGPLLALCTEELRQQGAAVAACLHLNPSAAGPFRRAGFLRRRSEWHFLARPQTPELGAVILDARNWFLTSADSNVDRERAPSAAAQARA